MQVDKQKGRGKDATNFQGDVLRILDETGTTVAAYTYDPWGKLLSATGTLAETNRQIRRRTIRCPRKKLFPKSNCYWKFILCYDAHFQLKEVCI